jgi:hypothetical protein
VLGEVRQARRSRGLLPLARSDDHEHGDPFALVARGHGVQPVPEPAALEDVPAQAHRGQIAGRLR